MNEESNYKDLLNYNSRSKHQLQKKFEEQKRNIAEIKRNFELTQDTEKIKKRKEKAKEDFGFFVKTYLSHYTVDPYTEENIESPWFHVEAANKIAEDNREFKGVLEWSRGFGKTTFSMMLIIWLIINNKIKFLLYVSKSKDFSVTQIANLQSELENNQMLIQDFGNFKEDGAKWSQVEFEIKPFDCYIAAIGRGQSPRGFKYKNHRPDLILIDDIDDNQLASNDRLVKQLIDWFKDELYNTVSTYYKIVLINNKFTNKGLTSYFVNNISNIYHSKVNALNENDVSNWEELYPTSFLHERRKVLGNISFQREFQNNPIIEGKMFNAEGVLLKKMNIEDYDKMVMYIDPSWNDNSDYKSVVSLGYINNEFHIYDIFLKKCSMSVMIEYLYTFYLQNYAHTNIIIYMESNFGQNYLQKEFDEKEKQYNIKLPLKLDNKKKQEKYARIESITPYFERKEIFFNKKLESTEDYNEAIAQLLGYEKNTKLNDDFPDALEGAISKINISNNININNILITQATDDFEF